MASEANAPNNSPIPDKHYFTISEVGRLCHLKPHVLRYWEQEFEVLRSVKRRANRRYYQRHEVLLIRRICELLYEEGFTIQGARQQLAQHRLPGLRNSALPKKKAMSPPKPALETQKTSPENFDIAKLRADLLALQALLSNTPQLKK